MKKVLFIFVLFVCFVSIKAQRQAIFVNDSVIYVGQNIIDQTREEFSSKVIVGSDEMSKNIYHPEDIRGFTLKDGTAFVSKKISLNQQVRDVFLEILVKDRNTTIYCYRNEGSDYFFFESVEMPLRQITFDAEPYKSFLDSLSSSCIRFAGKYNEKFVLTRKNIKYRYRAASSCNPNLIRNFRWGILIQMGISSCNVDEYGQDTDYHFTGGLFADLPFTSTWSFHPELQYMKDALSYPEQQIGKMNVSYIINRKSLLLPLLLRYSLTQKSSPSIPYFEFGPLVGYAFSGDGLGCVSTESPGIVDMDIERNPVTPFYWGGNIGGGIEFALTARHSLLVGLRYMLTSTGLENKSMIHYGAVSISFNLK